MIVRMNSNLSFAGEGAGYNLDGAAGVLLKPSEKSELKIWCPKDEIQEIILPTGKVIKGGFYGYEDSL